jgi:hypothetical protein
MLSEENVPQPSHVQEWIFSEKKRPRKDRFERGKRKEGVSSGKAMQDDAVLAHAGTLVLWKSKKLEEG